MRSLLRRLRGVIKTGVTWALGWASAFVLISSGASLVLGFPFEFLEALVAGGVMGFVSGGTFAGILSLAEGRRTLDELSLKRVALWGGVGGIALFLVFIPRLIGAGLPLGMAISALLGPMAITGLLGAGSAAGSVALARRGDEKMIDGEDGVPLLDRD